MPIYAIPIPTYLNNPDKIFNIFQGRFYRKYLILLSVLLGMSSHRQLNMDVKIVI